MYTFIFVHTNTGHLGGNLKLKAQSISFAVVHLLLQTVGIL